MSVLYNRNFAFLTVGQVISTFGDYLFTIALYWYMLNISNSPRILAWTGVCLSVGPICGIVSGVFVDRWNKVRVMWITDVLRGLLCVSMFWVCLNPHPSLALVFILICVLPVLGTLFNPAYFATFPLSVPNADLPAASGFSQSARAISRFAGMAGGGSLLAVMGAPFLFLGNGVSFFLSAVSIWGIRLVQPPRVARRLHLWKDWSVAITYIRSSRLLGRVVVCAALKNLALAPLEIVIAAWIKNGIGGGAGALGMLLGAELVGVFISGLVMRWLAAKVPLPLLLFVCSVATGGILFPMGFLTSRTVAVLFMVCSGLTSGLAAASSTTIVMRQTPAELRGRVSGLVSAIARLTFPIGMLVFGTLVILLPYTLLFMVVGIVAALPASGLVFLWKSPAAPSAVSESHAQ